MDPIYELRKKLEFAHLQLLIILGAVILFGNESIEGVSVATLYFLYGSLAEYFGIRDFISCIHTKSNTISISKEQTA